MGFKKSRPRLRSNKFKRTASSKTNPDKSRSRARAKNPKKSQIAVKKLKKDPGLPNLLVLKTQLAKKAFRNQASRSLEAAKLIKGKGSAPGRKSKTAHETTDRGHGPASFDGKEIREKVNPLNKKYAALLEKVVKDADVVLFVVDARDPQGCRDRRLEALIRSKDSAALGTKKRVVLVINKIDLVPAAVAQSWLEYLKRELPVVVFKASTQGQKSHLGISKTSAKNITDRELAHTRLAIGAENLLSLLKNYSRDSNNGKTAITVGVVGYPNVGKSSIINSLKRRRIASTSPKPGHTKQLQDVFLDSKLRLIDSPGVLFASGSNYSSLVLKNSVRVEELKAPQEFIAEILKKCLAQNLSEIYQIPPFKSADEFLYLVANRKGILSKGGKVNVDLASRAVIRDWNTGKISYYTEPPENKGIGLNKVEIVETWGETTKYDGVTERNLDNIATCEMRGGDNPCATLCFAPLAERAMVDE